MFAIFLVCAMGGSIVLAIAVFGLGLILTS